MQVNIADFDLPRSSYAPTKQARRPSLPKSFQHCNDFIRKAIRRAALLVLATATHKEDDGLGLKLEKGGEYMIRAEECPIICTRCEKRLDLINRQTPHAFQLAFYSLHANILGDASYMCQPRLIWDYIAISHSN